MVRDNQIIGLQDANKHQLIAGLLVNFRNEKNDTFFILIDKYVDMIESLHKKSFNVKDLENINAIYISSTQKRTRYKYDIEKFIKEVASNYRCRN